MSEEYFVIDWGGGGDRSPGNREATWEEVMGVINFLRMLGGVDEE